MLLKSNFPIRNTTKDGFNAIHICALRGNLKIMNIFIDYLKLQGEEYLNKHLAIINNKWQMNALSLAIKHNHKDIAAVLIKNKIKLYYDKNDALKDKSPIFLALNPSDCELIEQMHTFNHSALEFSKNSEGDTAILVASKKNYIGIINYLSLRIEQLDQEDNNNISLLLNLVLNSNFRMATSLIQRGANIDYANSKGQTALSICV